MGAREPWEFVSARARCRGYIEPAAGRHVGTSVAAADKLAARCMLSSGDGRRGRDAKSAVGSMSSVAVLFTSTADLAEVAVLEERDADQCAIVQPGEILCLPHPRLPLHDAQPTSVVGVSKRAVTEIWLM